MRYEIIPSIIAGSQEELDERISKVKDYVDWIQLDIMDGDFVENSSIDFDFSLPKGKYEAHLMVDDPDSWIEKNSDKVDKIIFHYEAAEDVNSTIRLIKNKKKIAGIAINPGTPLGLIRDFTSKVNHILIMTVNPGKYGSNFLPYTLGKIKELRELKPNIDIEVDGSINLDTIKQVKQAGANLFVSGSYVQNTNYPASNIAKLKDMVNKDGQA